MKGVTPSARRRRHDPRETEREILEAAEALLRERPFREVTVEEVMRATGLKRPAFYVHFRDRHHLVLRVVEHLGDDLRAASAPWLEGAGDLLGTLEQLAEAYARHGTVLRALVDASGSDAGVEASYRALVEALIAAVTERIRAEQAAGRIGDLDPADTAAALVWLNERYLSETLGRSPQAEPAAVARTLHRIWSATLYGSA